jgi:hypothetical protein
VQDASAQLVRHAVQALALALHVSPHTTGPPAVVPDPHGSVGDHALAFGISRPPPTR